MEEDREYNACKALDPQIDNEDDVHHNSLDYEINEREIQKQMWLGGLHRCNEWAGRTERSGFSGGLLWIGRTGGIQGWVNWGGRGGQGKLVDRADSIILDGADWAEYRTGWTGVDWADWGGRGGLVDGADYGILDGADWSGRGGLGRIRRTGRRGAYEASLGGHKGRTGKPGAGVPVYCTNRLRYTRPGRLASSRLRAEGIPGVLSSDADYGIIWLHTSGIHIRFFCAHVVVIFLGLTLQRHKEPLLVTSFLVCWELSTSRIPCSSKWGMPSATL